MYKMLIIQKQTNGILIFKINDIQLFEETKTEIIYSVSNRNIRVQMVHNYINGNIYFL